MCRNLIRKLSFSKCYLNYFDENIFIGFLLTGGDCNGNGSATNSVEVVSLDDSVSYFIKDLPEPRSYHTTDNQITCGGYETPGKFL